jgi:hypothetical protein
VKRKVIEINEDLAFTTVASVPIDLEFVAESQKQMKKERKERRNEKFRSRSLDRFLTNGHSRGRKNGGI